MFVGKKKPVGRVTCVLSQVLQGNPTGKEARATRISSSFSSHFQASNLALCVWRQCTHTLICPLYPKSRHSGVSARLQGFPIVQFSRSYIPKAETSPPPKKKVTKSSPIFNFSP